MTFPRAMVLALVALLTLSFTIASFADPKLSEQEKKLIKEELVEKITAKEISGEFSTNLAEIDGLQAYPRTKSVLSEENLKEGLVIAMLRYQGKEVPLLMFAASLSASLKEKTEVEYAVAFLEPPNQVVGVRAATVSKLEEELEQPRIALEWREKEGTYPVILTLEEGNLRLECPVLENASPSV